MNAPPVWPLLREEASRAASGDAAMAGLLNVMVLGSDSFSHALSRHLARKLGGPDLSVASLRDIIENAHRSDPSMVEAAEQDLHAAVERDPTCTGFARPFLFFKGFLALQIHRVASFLHGAGRERLAAYLQSRCNELFQVDIHPAASIGRGVFIDHGTGVVIGETAVVGDEVSILQGVTLGGTGAGRGDRHPRIGRGVLLSADAKVLGPISIGDYAKIAAGSVVLSDVPARCTAVGAPARLVNCPPCDTPARTMDQGLPEVG